MREIVSVLYRGLLIYNLEKALREWPFSVSVPYRGLLIITTTRLQNSIRSKCFRPLSGTTYLFYNEYTQMNMNEVSFPSPIGDYLSITYFGFCVVEEIKGVSVPYRGLLIYNTILYTPYKSGPQSHICVGNEKRVQISSFKEPKVSKILIFQATWENYRKESSHCPIMHSFPWYLVHFKICGDTPNLVSS